MRLFSALLGSTLAAGVSLGGAQAADLPRRAAPPVYAPAIPVFTWTGFYVGANAGYGFSGSSDNSCSSFGCLGAGNNLVVPAAPTGVLTPAAITGGTTGVLGSGTGRNDGFVGGGQIGYNYQLTPGSGFVLGVEADAQYAGFSRNSSLSNLYGTGGFLTAAPVADGTAGLGILAPAASAAGNVALFNNAFANGTGNRGIDWFGTVRGRVGYAIDRLLIFGTAGVAFTSRNGSDCTYCSGIGFNSGATVPTAFFATPAAAAAGALVTPTTLGLTGNTGNNVGYAVGGGVEYAFTNNLSAKIEGLYVNFGRKNASYASNGVVGVSNTGAPVTAASYTGSGSGRNDFGVVRLGLNYRFSAF